MNNSQQQISIPRIGAYWPEQGGIRIAEIPGQNGAPDYHLIAPTDPRALFIDVQWGKRGKDIPGATSDWDGMANTIAMSEAGSDLAQKILTLEIDGHSDFYLPARHELRFIKLIAPQLIESDWHWSSTQCSADSAWCQFFGGGYQYDFDKFGERRARAVRRFVIHSAI